MKTIVVSQKGKELSRFIPVGRSTLVGRSPSCDVVMRSRAVKPVHFLVEWVGAGDFDPNQGLWTIVNLTQKSKDERDVGEGLVLSTNPIQAEGFEFKIVQDELAESQIRRGVLTRRVEEIKGDDGQVRSTATVAEVIYFRKDIEAITNVRHFDSRLPSVLAFPSLPQVRFTWQAQMPGIGFIENQGEKKEFSIFNRGQEITRTLDDRGKKVEVRSSDFITIETADYDYFVRLVPPVRVELIPLAWLKDPTVRLILLLLLVLMMVGTYMAIRPPEAVKEPEPPPRVATVVVEDLTKKPPPPPPPPPKEEEVQPTEAPKKVVETKTPSPKQDMQTEAKTSKPTRASAPSVKNTTKAEKNRAGLNSPAPVKNVNSVGLLGKLGGGKRTGETVSADMIVNKGVVADTATGNTGVVVSQPPAGDLGHGRGGSLHGDNTLAGASTTLKNNGLTDDNSAGALSMTGGKSKFSAGMKLGGGEGAGGGKSGGISGDGNMEVSGGLDKDAIRRALAENRRAIRTCYETALLARKDLEGRLTLRWKITPQGPVETIVIQSSTVNLSSLESCVMKVVKGIVFPQAPNKMPTTVIYPFVFQGKK
jgi:outer membrane biosynthesis protein TonB